MSQLSIHNLPDNTSGFRYGRSEVKSGIVHFGIGNFHRAHQAVYCEDLLEKGDKSWGITGVSLRSSSMKEALKPQDYLYTLAILGKTTEYRIIGAIQDVLVAPNNPKAVIDLIANPLSQVVSSTITEKGYYLGPDGVNFDAPNLKHDLNSLEHPKTIFGFLAAGIIQRSNSTDPSSNLTIMCCDNISSGGEALHQGVSYLLRHHNPQALNWATDHVSFISSMVDRVCPATDDALREQVLTDTGRHDARPVSAEPFTQWIIEDNFAGEKPNFDTVGAVFVDDIGPFERMKLQYLNAAHTIVSTLGYLYDDKYVHETLRRPEVLKFTREALEKNILPNAAVPKGYDGQTYIEAVISRFQNQNLPYANLQVGTDSSQKIQQRWFPTIQAAIDQNANTSYFQFALAAWIIFIKRALANSVLNDPKLSAFQQIETGKLEVLIPSYLKIADADQFNFESDDPFMKGVFHYAHDLQKNGISPALSDVFKAS